MPSKREALTVTVIMALFLLLTSIFIGLRSEHLLMAVLYLVFFFLSLVIGDSHPIDNVTKTHRPLAIIKL